jgi:type IV fimbrial biogenesis protein FimT
MCNNPIKNQGFTLMELMVTVSIAGILMFVAMPSFKTSISGNRLTTYANELVTSLNLARSEAVKRGISVSVRKVDTDSSTNLSAGANWENGWDVFTDTDSDGKFEAGDTLIRTHESLPANFTLRGNNNFVNFIRYTPMGAISNPGGGSFVVCDNSDGNGIPEANISRLIIVNSAGRTRMGVDVDHDGIPEKVDGTEILSCIKGF